MSGGHIVLECQKCSTRYKTPSIEELKPCDKCGSYVQTVKYGRIPVETEDIHNLLTIKRRRKKPLMAKAKIVKMPSDTKKKKVSKPTKTVKKTESSVGKKFKGKTSNLGVLAYQNKTILDNRRAKLDDKSLTQMWCNEFPGAKDYTEKTVASVRRAFNRGKHGNDAPARPIPEFDRNGDPIKKEKAAPKVEKKKSVKKSVKKRVVKKVQDDDDDDDDDLEALDDDDEE